MLPVSGLHDAPVDRGQANAEFSRVRLGQLGNVRCYFAFVDALVFFVDAVNELLNLQDVGHDLRHST